MQSRLLDSLLDQAQTAPDRVEWARAVCRAAAHLARSGQPEHALATIGKVREEFGPGLHPGVASWLMLAEGILNFTLLEMRSAYDRILRAHGLAVAFKIEAAIPTCAAWMAVLEFNYGKHPEMIQHLQEVFHLAPTTDHQALGRASLVAATALHICGDFASARPWYDRSRWHASREGDEATLGAGIFNMAIIRMVDVRLSDAFDAPVSADTLRAAMEAAGSLTYDQMTGNSSQEPWRALLLGQKLISERSFARALEVLKGISVESTTQDKKTAGLAFADRAWCLLQMGRLAEAYQAAQASLLHVNDNPDREDRAYIMGRIAQVSFANRLAEPILVSKETALKALNEYRTYQSEFRSLLLALPSYPPK
jgi:tetratricopeptide (TPR) repeat protein